MRQMPFAELADLATDPSNEWSIGSFGAIGEFVREREEPTNISRGGNRVELSTALGAIRLVSSELFGVAWDSLSSDGTGWSHNLALCVPASGTARGTIKALGRDEGAILPGDRRNWLFDLGVSRGLVRMCVRTDHPGLKAMLDQAVESDFLSRPDLGAQVLAAQPHRVLLSPAGRIEVFQPIPGPHEESPFGPHTHLLPRLISSRRLHGANDAIPNGWQAVLNLHPPRPWTGERNSRHLDRHIDAGFRDLLDRYGHGREAELERRLTAHVAAGDEPSTFPWPLTRRERIKARRVLRRLSAAGVGNTHQWRACYDRRPGNIRADL